VHNKKNLKNFFRDRIPAEGPSIRERPVFFSPIQVFSMRKLQFDKQEQTKIKFHKSVDVAHVLDPEPQTGKGQPTCKLSPKNKTRCQRGAKEPEEQIFEKAHSASINYRAPTENSAKKYTLTLKNKVYNWVFGKEGRPSPSPQLLLKQRTQPIRTTSSKKHQLNDYVLKLSNFYNQIQLSGCELTAKPHPLPNPETPQQLRIDSAQQQILEWVKLSSQNEHNKNVGNNPISQLEDIEKVDSVFYKNMVAHKKNRLWVRRHALSKANFTEVCRKKEYHSPTSHLNGNESAVLTNKLSFASSLDSQEFE
jgi:hypothetical protein